MQSMRCSITLWIGMVLCLVLVAWVVGCRGNRGSTLPAPDPAPARAAPGAQAGGDGSGSAAAIDVKGVSGHPLAGDAVVGSPVIVENLTVFPILSGKQTDIGPITTLHSALAKGVAEVRELGRGEATRPEPIEEDGPVGQRVQPSRQHARLVGRSDGPRVGTLVIENRGEVPIYVLAGTVMKGGNQDRQIAQDFLVAARTTVPIDAFCVEHGRWSGQRQGQATGGKFTAMQQLATSEVRVAGQYEQDQSKVWSKVGKVK